MAIIFLCIVVFLFPGIGAAQPVDTLITNLTFLAAFEEASALDVDPAGNLYVVDKGNHSIFQFSQDGSLVNQLGGPGQGEGQFDAPSDIDVTNGLVLVVADAGNGRIQRFSKNFLFLEMLPVAVDDGDQAGAAAAPAYRRQLLSGTGAGRPVGVITASDNAMYAIDETASVVVKWDNNRNIEQYIGAYDQGAGSLSQPVALTLSPAGALYVADRGHEAVLVYDAFGGFDRTIAEGLCADVQSVYVYGDYLFVVLKDKLLKYQLRGRLESVTAFEAEGPLVDVVIFREKLFLLTEKGLYSSVFSDIK